MQISELLRIFADTIDRIAAIQDPSPQPKTDNEEPLGDFIPPLQQKLELLKKAVDVPNYYDENSNTDELTTIKKNAGLNAQVLDQLVDNDILDT